MERSMASHDEHELFDVIIVGAGPAGLAVASRLREETPSALFTDEEHQRYHWIKKHSGRMTLVKARNGKMRNVKANKYVGLQVESKGTRYSALSPPRYSVLVLDSSGHQWLSRWRKYFDMLEIQQLRSPMFFHIDPGDRDGMLAYAKETGREDELWELQGCVGRESSKHKKKKRLNARITREPEIDERDRKDYYSPGTRFFLDYCNSIACRYELDKPGQILQDEVEDIKFDYVSNLQVTDRVFMVTTKNGGTFHSRAVVLATGPGNEKNYPWELSPEERMGATHILDIRALPSPVLQRRIQDRKETNVLVVGGGLTSAQISDVIIKKGVTKVWLLMRGDLKIKHFDVDLQWVGKFRNYEKAVFWSADDDEERFRMINQARNGGSINPRYHKILREHMARKRLSLHTRTVIRTREYDAMSKMWIITTDPPIPDLPAIDYIYFATGTKSDVNEMPMLRHMMLDYPIETKGGMPCITNDLMWKENVPLFCTGRLAALRLGPAGQNLEGAREGAERIAWALDEVLGQRSNDDKDPSWISFAGLGNRYAGLASGE
ncbi:hypothetical protein VTO42DRAFT_4715 [Malbranchea cinnamomea]